MEVVIDAPEELASLAAGAIEALLDRKPEAVLGLATGSSPLGIYDELARRHGEGRLSFSRARAFMLDEYVGLPLTHPQRYRNVIEREIASRVGFGVGAVLGPDGLAQDVVAACAQYEEAIVRAGGVDLQILGIGTDGHVGFNEPGSSFASLTRIKTLAEQTRRDNARFFGSLAEVPMHCITQGLGTIMRARHLLFLAWGEGKAEAVAGAVEGPVTSSLPGSAIQLHRKVTVIVDEAAASRLRFADYYRYAWDNRLAWERV